jgi:large subunit ribosomal protein L10
MIKASGLFRNSIVERLKNDIGKADSIFIIQYLGLSSNQMTALRNELKEVRSQLLVTRNTFIRRALKDSHQDGVDTFVEGPSALVFGYDDIVATAKVLIKFLKENQNLVIKGGSFHNRVLDKTDVEQIASLPSKAVLRAQVVSLLMGPLAGLVFTLKGSLSNLVIVLGQIREQKEKKPVITNQDPVTD